MKRVPCCIPSFLQRFTLAPCIALLRSIPSPTALVAREKATTRKQNRKGQHSANKQPSERSRRHAQRPRCSCCHCCHQVCDCGCCGVFQEKEQGVVATVRDSCVRDPREGNTALAPLFCQPHRSSDFARARLALANSLRLTGGLRVLQQQLLCILLYHGTTHLCNSLLLAEGGIHC